MDSLDAAEKGRAGMPTEGGHVEVTIGGVEGMQS